MFDWLTNKERGIQPHEAAGPTVTVLDMTGAIQYHESLTHTGHDAGQSAPLVLHILKEPSTLFVAFLSCALLRLKRGCHLVYGLGQTVNLATTVAKPCPYREIAARDALRGCHEGSQPPQYEAITSKPGNDQRQTYDYA